MIDSKGITRITDVVAMIDLDDADPRPPAVTYWKLIVRGDSSGAITIKYTEVASYSFAVGEDIYDLMERLFAGTQPAWQPVVNNNPRRSRLSIQNDEWRYQIFVLDSANCYFSKEQVAFTIEKGRKDYYRHPRSVWQDDVIGTIHHDREPPGNVNCKVAYFADMTHVDPNEAPAGFNIQLDVEDSEGGLLPISVDPDVGYPGGHS